MASDIQRHMRSVPHTRKLFPNLSVIRPLYMWLRYSLAVNYLFLTDSGSGAQVEFAEEPFNALAERNDYEVRLHSV